MSRSKYPNSIDTSKEIPVLRDDIVQHGSKIINSLRSAVIQLEKTLGTNPQGFEGNTVSARLNTCIDELGNIKREALEYLNLISGPISNSDVKSDANISEDKLKLEFSTTFLYNQSESLKRLIDEINLFLDDINSKLSSHLSADAKNRHTGKNINIEAIPKSISDIAIKDSEELSLKDLLNKIFTEHFNYTGKDITQDNNSHLANQIYFENSNFNILEATDVQSAIDELSGSNNSDLEAHQLEMHSNSKTKTYSKEIEIAPSFQASFSSYSYLSESKGTSIAPVTPFENDSVIESNFIKLVFEEQNYYYNIIGVTRDASGLITRIDVAESLSVIIQDQEVSVVSLSESADFFSMNLARYEFYPKTNSSVAVLVNPTAPTIYSDFINLSGLTSTSNLLSFDVSGKTYLVDCLPIGDININSVVEKINEELAGLAAPIIAYVSNENRDKLCISHFLESNGSRYIKLESSASTAISALGFSDFEDIEVYGSKFSSFFIFGKKHTSLNTKVFDSNFTIESSNIITSLTGINFSEYGVRKGDLLVIEGSTNDDGAYRISSLNDTALTIDVPSGIFSGQAVGTGAVFYIKDITCSYQDLILTSPNFSPSDESGLHSIYINKDKDIVTKNILAYEAQDQTFHINDAEIKTEEEVQIDFSINIEDKIEVDLDGNKRIISDFDESSYKLFTKSGNMMNIFVSSYSDLYTKISSNINKIITSSIKTFLPLDKFQNLFIGNVVFDNFTGTLRGSKEFGYSNKVDYGSIGKKDIAGSFIREYFEEYRASASKNSIFHGCEIHSVSDDGSSNYKFSISSGKAIVNGREIYIDDNEYFTNIEIIASNDRVYIALDERGNVLFQTASSSGCDCPFDLSTKLILGVINYKNYSGIPYLETVDLRIFLSESGSSSLGTIYIDADKSKNNFRSISSAFKYAKSLSYISDKIGVPKIIFGPGKHTHVDTQNGVKESGRNNDSNYKSIAETIYDAGAYIDFPVIIQGCGPSTVLSFSTKWLDNSTVDNSRYEQEGIIFISGERQQSGSYAIDRPLASGLGGRVLFRDITIENTKIWTIEQTNATLQESLDSDSELCFENVYFKRTGTFDQGNTTSLTMFSEATSRGSYYFNKIYFYGCTFLNSSIKFQSKITTTASYDSSLSALIINGCNITKDSSGTEYFIDFEDYIVVISRTYIRRFHLIGNSNSSTMGLFKGYESASSQPIIDFYESSGLGKKLSLYSGNNYVEIDSLEINMFADNINILPDSELDIIVENGAGARLTMAEGVNFVSQAGFDVSATDNIELISDSGNLSAYGMGSESRFGNSVGSNTIIHSDTNGMQFAQGGSSATINTTNLTVDSNTTFNGNVSFGANYTKSYVRNFMCQVVSYQESVILYESTKISGSFFGYASPTDAFSGMIGDNQIFGEFIIPRKNGRIIHAFAVNRNTVGTGALVTINIARYDGSGDINLFSNYTDIDSLGLISTNSMGLVLDQDFSGILTPPTLVAGEIYVLYAICAPLTHTGVDLQVSLTIEEDE